MKQSFPPGGIELEGRSLTIQGPLFEFKLPKLPMEKFVMIIGRVSSILTN